LLSIWLSPCATVSLVKGVEKSGDAEAAYPAHLGFFGL
jgi:hypothetical protein